MLKHVLHNKAHCISETTDMKFTDCKHTQWFDINYSDLELLLSLSLSLSHNEDDQGAEAPTKKVWQSW